MAHGISDINFKFVSIYLTNYILTDFDLISDHVPLP